MIPAFSAMFFERVARVTGQVVEADVGDHRTSGWQTFVLSKPPAEPDLDHGDVAAPPEEVEEAERRADLEERGPRQTPPEASS